MIACSGSTFGPLEVWGGLEASVVRVDHDIVDQIRLTGHDRRKSDLDAFAALGLKAIRYPILWERVAPGTLADADWRWCDERLGRLRELGVWPIVGLLHHGQGPSHTNLLASDFPQKFAAYAAAVAARYPWVDAYTPINEPLTTARFCGLYGLWQPHARDPRVFARILVNQIRATQLAMRAIRSINPKAQLVQTEDLGKAHSTERLSYQAEFENERRWLTFDLLTGRVDARHTLWQYLAEAGVASDLEAIAADPCPPDILGIDHYLTSERFLDERIDAYPEWTHTRNGRDTYADVEAIRVVADGVRGPERLGGDAWERYRLPIAFTEAHNACTREEQLRWFKDVWDGAVRLREAGVDVRAVTAWALLGAFDWNSLMTRRVGHYESGVFDIRGEKPRPTALAWLIRSLATRGEAEHPVLDAPGWWRRADRFTYTPVRSASPEAPELPRRRAPKHQRAPILVAGGGGAFASAVVRECELRGLEVEALTRAGLDIADPDSVAHALDRVRPWAVVNAAGFTRVARAETAVEQCWRDNVVGAATLADACHGKGVPFLGFSSHLVFDGRRASAYTENDAVAPLGIYGMSKAAAEDAVLSRCPGALVVRAGPAFGPWHERNLLAELERRLAAGETRILVPDSVVTPSYVPDLVSRSLDLLIDGEAGLWHLANAGPVSIVDWITEIAAAVGGDASAARAACRAWADALRPSNSALASMRGSVMPSLEDALARYVDWRRRHPAVPAEPVAASAAA